MKDSLPQSILSVTGALAGLLYISPMAQAAAPTLTVQAIVSPVTNSAILIKGTTADASGTVANVFYELNNSGFWYPAEPTTTNGFSKWAGLVTDLTVGLNNIKVYAANDAGQNSRTNSLNFTYKPVALLEVLFSGTGKGKIVPNANGQNLYIGMQYTITAVPDLGSDFIEWTVGGSNETKARYTFTMVPGLSLTATFEEAATTIPGISVTAPASTKSSNSVVIVSGTAKDDVAVTNVYYVDNFGATNLGIITTNGYANWSAVLILSPGENVVRFYAQNAAGNTSKSGDAILSLKDTSDGFAPLSLAGTILSFESGSSNSATAFFGTSTLAIISDKSFEVDDYAYMLSNSSTAQFVHQSVAPKGKGGGNGLTSSSGLTFSFTTTTSGTYTNSDGGGGTFTLSPATGEAPLSLEEATLWLNGTANTSSNYFSNGNFTAVSEPSGASGSGPYTYAVYSPQVALYSAAFTNTDQLNDTNYVLLDFGSGTFYSTSTSISTGVQFDSGPFTLTRPATAPGGHAPVSLAGRTANVTSTHTETNDGKKIITITMPKVSFGDATFGQFDSNTNDNADVGNYIYSRTGPDTGLLSFYPIASQDTNDNKNTGIELNFNASGATTFTNGNDHGSITLTPSAATVPVSVAGSIILFTPSKSSHTVLAEFGDSTFVSIEKGQTNAGTYLFGQFGPQVALLQFNELLDLSTNYVTLWFTSAASGNFASRIINSDGSVTNSVGTFSHP